MKDSAISWTDHTFNPWIGCTKVSPACDHCYAERLMDARMHRVTWGGERVRTSAANWKQPLRWNAQAEREGRRFRVFCASLADVFDNEVPAEWRADLFHLIRSTPHLDWLLLTKRIGNVDRMVQEAGARAAAMGDSLAATGVLPPNVWLGATVVKQDEADRDIPKLLSVPAAKRFLSIEPMLGPIDLRALFLRCCGRYVQNHPEDGPECCREPEQGIDWVIVGGESGPQARPMHPQWARDLRDQCAAAGVAFHFKQWGEWAVARPDHYPAQRSHWWKDDPGSVVSMVNLGAKKAGRLLDGVEHNGVPA